MRVARHRSLFLVTGSVLVAGLLWVSIGGDVLAKKPPKPPPEPEPTVEGTIYFTSKHNAYNPDRNLWDDPDAATVFDWQIDADGSNLMTRTFGVPSAAEHDGSRWFLQLRYDPPGAAGPASLYHPCGTRHMELFAVSDVGEVVQLTDDLQLRFNGPHGPLHISNPKGQPTWATDELSGQADGKVSFLGVRWNTAAEPAPAPNPPADPDVHWVVEHGLFVLRIDWSDSTPQVVGVPERVDVGDRRNVVEYYRYDDAGVLRFVQPGVGVGGALFVEYSWSSDGASLVFYNRYAGDDVTTAAYPGLWRLDAARSWDAPAQVLDGRHMVGSPAWQPGGSDVCVRTNTSADGRGLYLVDVSGSPAQSLRTLVPQVRDSMAASPTAWAPDGSRVAFTMVCNNRFLPDIFKVYGRVTTVDASGGGQDVVLDGRRFDGEWHIPQVVSWR